MAIVIPQAELGEPEVEQLDVEILVEEKVLTLEVLVHDVQVVAVLNGRGELVEHLARHVLGQGSLALDELVFFSQPWLGSQGRPGAGGQRRGVDATLSTGGCSEDSISSRGSTGQWLLFLLAVKPRCYARLCVRHLFQDMP